MSALPMNLVAASFWSTPVAQLVLACLVGGAVFALGWLLLGTAARAKKDREVAARVSAVTGTTQPVSQAPVDGTTGWIPDRVTHFGKRFAESRGFSDRLDAELEAAGVSIRSGEFVVVSVVAVLIGGVLGAAILGNPLLAGVVAVVCGAAPTVALRTALKRRTEKLREQLPDVLTIMASSLRAGHSFMQALDTVAREIPAPAAGEFQRLISEIRLGRPTDDALEALSERVGSGDFKWAVLAVNIQREVGGNLAEILDNVADTLRERAQMRRQIRVLTAEGRLSAWVLTAMPLAIAGYMFIVNPEYIGLLFTTKLGLIMVFGAGLLLVAGVLWMRKIVDIDV
ncbi:MAG TPA: type II secretion system F family protein [Actinomycetota bacterium]